MTTLSPRRHAPCRRAGGKTWISRICSLTLPTSCVLSLNTTTAPASATRGHQQDDKTVEERRSQNTIAQLTLREARDALARSHHEQHHESPENFRRRSADAGEHRPRRLSGVATNKKPGEACEVLPPELSAARAPPEGSPVQVDPGCTSVETSCVEPPCDYSKPQHKATPRDYFWCDNSGVTGGTYTWAFTGCAYGQGVGFGC